jgi:hypothetical protein
MTNEEDLTPEEDEEFNRLYLKKLYESATPEQCFGFGFNSIDVLKKETIENFEKHVKRIIERINRDEKL